MVPESFENLPYDDIKRIYSRHSAKVTNVAFYLQLIFELLLKLPLERPVFIIRKLFCA